VERGQLEHLIRAASSISGDPEIVIVGSQAILGRHPDAPRSLRVSAEADLYPRNRPALAELIDGSIGELSPFHQTFGYYAQGVGPGTAVLPAGWEERLVRVRNENTGGATGWCLEPHDLVASKYVAGRGKDLVWIQEVIRHRLVRRMELLRRIDALPLDPDRRRSLAALAVTDFANTRRRQHPPQ
jgi:hypothetical protein